MINSVSPFDSLTGSDRLRSPYFIISFLLAALVVAVICSKLGIIGIGLITALPFIGGYLYLVFTRPIAGFYTAVAFGFVLIGMGRYLGSIPIGLAMDGILILTYIALIFKKFKDRVDWTPAKKDITVLSAIWFGYSILEFLNPEARSSAAWFSGRGIGLYMMLLVPLTLLFIDSKRKLEIFFFIWGFFALVAALKGIMQTRFGVDPWEQAWLNEGNFKTHVLFGKLRAFSFLSDAGQFGGNQAYSAVVAAIVAISQKNHFKRSFFIAVALFSFYGMIISGTRGALSIPIAGFGTYFILRKNKTVMLSGFLMLLVVFYFFKFTTIGQGNDNIRRMRTAFDPNDASLLVRLENQRILKSYLATRPLGGGIGHGGVKAQRYLPNAYLSQIPTDSWYVLIWVEQGIIGLLLHLFILFYVIIRASYKIMFRIRDPILKLQMAALASGMFGVMVASYGNAVLGQMPTSILIYISMAILLNTEALDKQETLQPKAFKQ